MQKLCEDRTGGGRVVEDCVFCKIAKGEIPTKVAYEDPEFVAFPDINPQAPVHLLVIPRSHFANLVEAVEKAPDLVSRLFAVVTKLAAKNDLTPEGFRVVCNNGRNGGQTVNHLHVHMLGGRFMGWPPG